MKKILFLSLIVFLLSFESCNKSIDEKTIPTPAPTSTPTQFPTPEIDWESYLYDEEKPSGSLTFLQAGSVFVSNMRIQQTEGHIRIDGGTFSFSEKYNGKYNLVIKLEGELLLGEGDFILNYKLYDENDFVVSNDSFFISGLSEGDKFKNQEITIRDIDIGNYKLTIQNYK